MGLSKRLQQSWILFYWVRMPLLCRVCFIKFITEISCRFFGDDCSEKISSALGIHVLSFQAGLAACYAVSFALSFVAACYSYGRTSLRLLLFITIMLISFINFILMIVDPLQEGEMIPIGLSQVLADLDLPLCATAFILVLFHWYNLYLIFSRCRIELVQIATKRMRKEHMLQQINVNYPGKPITVKEVVESINVLKRLRVPFAILGVESFVIIIVCDILFVAKIYPFMMFMIIYIYYSLLWITLTSGFLFYGKKLD